MQHRGRRPRTGTAGLLIALANWTSSGLPTDLLQPGHVIACIEALDAQTRTRMPTLWMTGAMGASGCFSLVSSLGELLPGLRELRVVNVVEPTWLRLFPLPTRTYAYLVSLCLENMPPPFCAALLCCVPSLERLTLHNDTFETAPPVEFDVERSPSFRLKAYTYIGRNFAFACLPIVSSADSPISLCVSTSSLRILEALETQPHRVRALFLEPPTTGKADVTLLCRFIRACRHTRDLCLPYEAVRDLASIVRSLAAPLRVLALDHPRREPTSDIHDTAREIAQALEHASMARLEVLALPAAVTHALRHYYSREGVQNTIFDDCRRRRIRLMTNDEYERRFFAAHAGGVRMDEFL